MRGICFVLLLLANEDMVHVLKSVCTVNACQIPNSITRSINNIALKATDARVCAVEEQVNFVTASSVFTIQPLITSCYTRTNF